MSVETTVVYCGHCGEVIESGMGAAHDECARRYPLDPPRYCSLCRRRMKVRITPAGWEATCSVHGVLTSS